MKISLVLPAIVPMAAIMASIPAVLAQQDSFGNMNEPETQMHNPLNFIWVGSSRDLHRLYSVWSSETYLIPVIL